MKKSSNHEIIISPSVFKDLKKIYKKDKHNFKRIKEGIKENPQKSNKMKQYLKGARKIRKGDYRIIFDIEGNEIHILDIMPRKQNYNQ